MQVVTLATFNIHHGRGLDDEVDLERTARVIRETGAELVALQELDRHNPRSGNVDQPAELARLTGLHVSFHPTMRRGANEYGLAVASKKPIVTSFQPLPRRADEEARGLIMGRLEDRGIIFIATHLSTAWLARRKQTQLLTTQARDLEPPAIVMGDLNQGRIGLWPLIRAGFDAGRRIEHTLTRRSLRWQIDFVMVGPPATLAATHTITTDASDHVPLVAEVVVP